MDYFFSTKNNDSPEVFFYKILLKRFGEIPSNAPYRGKPIRLKENGKKPNAEIKLKQSVFVDFCSCVFVVFFIFVLLSHPTRQNISEAQVYTQLYSFRRFLFPRTLHVCN